MTHFENNGHVKVLKAEANALQVYHLITDRHRYKRQVSLRAWHEAQALTTSEEIHNKEPRLNISQGDHKERGLDKVHHAVHSRENGRGAFEGHAGEGELRKWDVELELQVCVLLSKHGAWEGQGFNPAMNDFPRAWEE